MRNIDAKQAYDREYRRKHPTTPEKKSEYNRKSYSGITAYEFNSMLLKQNCLCAICNKELNVRDPRDVNGDHSHFTGKFRGILCKDCNLMLGRAHDSIDVLESAIQYLIVNGK